MKKFLSAVFMLITLSFTLVFASGIENGSEAYVDVGSMNVSRDPSFSKTVGFVSKGDKVKVLEAYTDGQEKALYHKIQLDDGTVGYVLAYAGGADTLKSAEITEKEYAQTTTPSDTDTYQHTINMYVLKDYIYGGKKSLDGERVSDYAYAKMPNEWTRHKRPDSLPPVGRAILHIGDDGKEGMIRASFYPDGYPGSPTENYHSKRLDELNAIGYMPPAVEYSRGNKNRAFFNMNTTEFEVVAYDENRVAVWSDGGVDTSRGIGVPCGGTKYIPYGSWKPGVYFFPRKYCYILDINNQVSEIPQFAATGKATAPLMIKI